jgi:hypothetical protein
VVDMTVRIVVSHSRSTGAIQNTRLS